MLNYQIVKFTSKWKNTVAKIEQPLEKSKKLHVKTSKMINIKIIPKKNKNIYYHK